MPLSCYIKSNYSQTEKERSCFSVLLWTFEEAQQCEVAVRIYLRQCWLLWIIFWDATLPSKFTSNFYLDLSKWFIIWAIFLWLQFHRLILSTQLPNWWALSKSVLEMLCPHKGNDWLITWGKFPCISRKKCQCWCLNSLCINSLMYRFRCLRFMLCIVLYILTDKGVHYRWVAMEYWSHGSGNNNPLC